jgi:hypothetical protein
MILIFQSGWTSAYSYIHATNESVNPQLIEVGNRTYRLEEQNR